MTSNRPSFDNFIDCYRHIRSAYYLSCGGHYEPKSGRDYELALQLAEIENWMLNHMTEEEKKVFVYAK